MSADTQTHELRLWSAQIWGLQVIDCMISLAFGNQTKDSDSSVRYPKLVWLVCLCPGGDEIMACVNKMVL